MNHGFVAAAVTPCHRPQVDLLANNPEGIESISPGLRVRRATLGTGGNDLQPQRGCIISFLMMVRRVIQPFQGCAQLVRSTQGSSRTRNPGLSDGIPLGFSDMQGRFARGILALLLICVALIPNLGWSAFAPVQWPAWAEVTRPVVSRPHGSGLRSGGQMLQWPAKRFGQRLDSWRSVVGWFSCLRHHRWPCWVSSLGERLRWCGPPWPGGAVPLVSMSSYQARSTR